MATTSSRGKEAPIKTETSSVTNNRVAFKLAYILLSYQYVKVEMGNGWNIFDLVIVVASLLDLALEGVDGISVMRGMRLVNIAIFTLCTSIV